ncbi:uncharacterized protein LOC143023637 isoform X1 [Oratosquilla oratoria]|uniref:uncharacterized protein LOC143023637 isoform X1 n=1 Tax=Oratosquilla oratoria TaxID=337810 RepID=UPI003F770F8B
MERELYPCDLCDKRFLSKRAADMCYNYHVDCCLKPQAGPSYEMVGASGSMEGSSDLCTLDVALPVPAVDCEDEEVDNPEPCESLAEEGVQKQRKGGKVKELWNYEATEALLQLVKANYTRLNDKKTTKAVVWKDITRVLLELGLAGIQLHHTEIPGLQLRQVVAKWRYLKSTFHHYEDYKKASGRGKKTEPRYYNLLSSILKNRPLSRPDLYVLEGTEVGTRSVAEIEVDNPVEEDPATQASLLDPQHGEASQRAPTPPQASPPDPQPAHASQAPQPAPATREEPPAARGNVPPPPPRRTRTRSLRPSADRKELLLCVKEMKNTLKTCSDEQENSMAEVKELLSSVVQCDRERHEMDRERHEMDMELKRERLNILRLKRIELERRQNNK